MYKYQIGISYASEQEQLAERINNLLEQNKTTVFFAKQHASDFLSTNLYKEIINIFKNECKYIVAIISDEYIEKDYTNQELSVALTRNKNGERCLIPIYTTTQRHSKISNDEYYIDYKSKKEPEIVDDILKFLNNNQIESESHPINGFSKEIKDIALMLKIPRDYQIFISGATGVGKSTIARNLVNIIPEFVIIEEADMLREAVRGENDRIVQRISEYAAEKGKGRAFNKDVLRNLLKYNTLKKSTIDLKYDELNEQCRLILAPLEKVCYRLMDKGMPAIIEGVNLSFEAMFENSESLYSTTLNQSNALFINLYLNNESDHKNRLIQRCADRRDNAETKHKYLKKLSNIRKTNDILHEKVRSFAEEYKNVFDIDASGTIEETILAILRIIQSSTR